MARMLALCSVALILLNTYGRADQAMTAAIEDGCVFTFGGGMGSSVFLKFDISSVPTGAVIDSVKIDVTVVGTTATWDGDMNYWNVNSQTWTEGDSQAVVWRIPTSDSVHQDGGFTGGAWERITSTDIKPIFMTDYAAGHTYCSVKMKDPDDRTFNPGPMVPLLFDSNDSMAVGSLLDSSIIAFFPHEFPNGPPWLVVYYNMPVQANRDLVARRGGASATSSQLFCDARHWGLRMVGPVSGNVHDLRGRVQSAALRQPR